MSLGELSVRLDKEPYALVVATQQRHTKQGTIAENSVVCGVVSRIDLLKYIANGPSK
jgi:hypothetical protein